MTTRIGLVGLGMMGATHLKAYRAIEGAEVAWLCDLDPARLAGDLSGAVGNIDTGAAGRSDLAGVRTTDEYADLLADASLDAIDLCVPTFLHADMALLALEAGKHVVCEKPLALTSADAFAVVEAARAAERLLLVGHCLRFWPEYVVLKGLVDAGRLGRVRAATFRRHGCVPGWAWDGWLADVRRSGSAALDLHVHDADLVRWYVGPPNEVSSEGDLDAAGGVVRIETRYGFDGGPEVVASGGWDLPTDEGFYMSAELEFEGGSARFDSRRSPTLLVREAGRETPPTVTAGDAYTEELRHIVACLAAGRPSERIAPEDAAAAVALVEAEVESVRTGRPVRVESGSGGRR